MRRWAHRTHLAGLLALLAACGAGERGDSRVARAAPPPPTPPQRIVSLSPAVTELLYALGAGERVVGRTTWCDYPPQGRAVPSVGDGLSPNLEAIAARRADLVVLYGSPHTARGARPPGGGGRGGSRGRAGGGLPSAGVGAQSLPPPPPALGVRVAFVVWDNPPMVIGSASYLDQLAGLAGARNAFHDL